MSAPTLSGELALAAAMDAGNAHMRRHGRSAWNDEDHRVATEVFRRLMHEIAVGEGWGS
jgi:hypothetical protein